MNDVYANFIQELMEVTGKVVVVQNKEIKINSHEWFDSETSEGLYCETNSTKKFENYRLHIDIKIYKTVWYKVQNFITKEKKEFF